MESAYRSANLRILEILGYKQVFTSLGFFEVHIEKEGAIPSINKNN
jgi:hypothetical protein